MLIAIPSVTRYINDSRKKSYIDTAKQYIKGTITIVNSGELDMYDTSVTYYIPSSCISLESGGGSPYGGEFSPAYILVTYDNNSFNFYWMSTDNQKMGIKTPTSSDKLNIKSIEPNVDTSDVLPTIGIDGRSTIVEFESDCSSVKETKEASTTIDGKTGKETKLVEYPEGKNKETVVMGDLVKIGTEEFYVIKHDGDDLVLLARYNLKIGNKYSSGGIKLGEYTSTDEGYGLQSIETFGYHKVNQFGTTNFSSSNYWNGKIGGVVYSGTYEHPNWPYVVDENSNVYHYLINYREYLENNGFRLKNIRLLYYNEAIELGCTIDRGICYDFGPEFLYHTSYWLGSAVNNYRLWTLNSSGLLSTEGYQYEKSLGIRPVIVI